MISTTDPRFTELHPQLLSAIQSDEARLRATLSSGVAACVEDAPDAVKDALSRMLTTFGEGVVMAAFEGLIETFTVMSSVIRNQERNQQLIARKPTGIN